jgi:hypothetical protein
MSDAAHEIQGQTSDFEFKLVRPNDVNDISFPISGKYQGWFHLKQSPPSKSSLKIDDKEIMIDFTPEDDHWTIDGKGYNKFGNFSLKGTLKEDGTLQMYREYVVKPLPLSKKRSTSSPQSQPLAKKSSLGGGADSAREGAGRIRKVSSILQGFDDGTPRTAPVANVIPASSPRARPIPNFSSKGDKNSNVGRSLSAPNPYLQDGVKSGRTPRMSQSLIKCGDMLKELQKNPNSIWFAEPVDFVKLQIFDYPTIITRPMDLKTVKSNLDGGVYENCEDFAIDVRLIFQNAMRYNQLRDNLVHIAARELLSRFEERFRIVSAQLQGNPIEYDNRGYEIIPVQQQVWKPQPVAKPKAVPVRRQSSGGGGQGGRGGGAKSRQSLPQAHYLPQQHYIDPNSQNIIIDMQRKIDELQSENDYLKLYIKNNEIKDKTEEKKAASQTPLTFEEKKTLIAKIHKLPPEKMTEVVQIIQSQIKPNENDSDEEIEIELDQLDTHTLRRLQEFVGITRKSLGTKKPRNSDGKPGPRKKQMDNQSNLNYTDEAYQSNSKDHDEEDLLFSTESFDDHNDCKVEGDNNGNETSSMYL